jgi:hypothetical protein
MRWIGFVGKLCAAAGKDVPSAMTTATTRNARIIPSEIELCVIGITPMRPSSVKPA